LAAFLPVSAGALAKAPCQKKKPITRANTDHSATTLQENFIFNLPLNVNMLYNRYLDYDFCDYGNLRDLFD
jgi:hypothetical protein